MQWVLGQYKWRDKIWRRSTTQGELWVRGMRAVGQPVVLNIVAHLAQYLVTFRESDTTIRLLYKDLCP